MESLLLEDEEEQEGNPWNLLILVALAILAYFIVHRSQVYFFSLDQGQF